MTYYDNEMDSDIGKYPELSTSIVWTPIPVLTWFLPLFGHIGIVTTTGHLRDFAGPYNVPTDNMAFGKPARFLKLDLNEVPGGAQAWDSAVTEAASEYQQRMHHLLCDNCHHMVVRALNRMPHGTGNWGMFKLALAVFFGGRFINTTALLKSLLPSILIYAAIVIVSCL